MNGQRRRRFLRQPRVPGGRDALSAGVIREIKDRVKREARYWGVSQAFVVNNALAITFGIKVHYTDYKVERKRSPWEEKGKS